MIISMKESYMKLLNFISFMPPDEVARSEAMKLGQKHFLQISGLCVTDRQIDHHAYFKTYIKKYGST